ncbi:MAG: alpha-amylase domain-containing protein, partial [Janthinobacterium lividum]
MRNKAIADDATYVTYKAWPIYSDTTTIAMKKGNVVAVLSNKGAAGASYSQVVPQTGYASGESVVEIVGCTTATVDSAGRVTVAMG